MSIAAEHGHLDIVKYLVEELKCDVESSELYDLNSFSPLHLASKNGYLDIVRYLIEKNAKLQCFGGKDADTPLHLAAHNNHLHVVKFLLDKWTGYSFVPNKNGKLPLYTALANDSKICALYLTVNMFLFW